MADDTKLLDTAAALLRAGAEVEEGYEERRRSWLDRYYLTQNPKVWEIHLNGAAVRVEDLPLRVIDRIAKDAPGGSWQAVVNIPLLDLAVAGDLLHAAAEYLGLEDPGDISVRQILDYFDLVPDTVPEPDIRAEEDDPLVPSSGPTTGTPG